MQGARLARLESILNAAILDGRQWTAFCNEMTHLSGAVATTLTPLDIEKRSSRIFHSDGVEHLLDLYRRDKWHLHDYRQRLLPVMMERGIAFDTDLGDPEQLKKLPYYSEFLLPHGIGGFFGILIRTSQGDWCIAVQLPVNCHAPDQELVELAPAIRSMTESAIAEADSVLARDRMDWVKSLEETGCELAIFNERSTMTWRSEDLANLLQGTALDLSSAKTGDLFARSLASCFGYEAKPVFPPPFTINAASGSITADFMQLPGRFRHFFTLPEVLVRFRKSANRTASLENVLSGRYKLTPSEIELVRALISGSLLRDAALTLKITEGTARQRLKAIFRKTSTEAQHQLVAKVLGETASLS